MNRVTWRGRIVPDRFKQWKEAHDNIWPEMTEALNQAGIHNYTIWAVGNELFGYYECADCEYAARMQAQSSVVARWNDSMKGLLEMCTDPKTGAAVVPELVFYHE